MAAATAAAGRLISLDESCGAVLIALQRAGVGLRSNKAPTGLQCPLATRVNSDLRAQELWFGREES